MGDWVQDFRALFELHAPYVWRVLRRLGIRAADVDDVVQEVFLVVHRKLDGFEGRSSVRTWIYGICVRKASDYRRRAHVRREVSTDPMPEHIGAADQDEAVDRSRKLRALDAMLSELDQKKREVFVLFEIEQLSMAEVADTVSCPVQTAYARLYAAREQLQLALRRLQSRGRVA